MIYDYITTKPPLDENTMSEYGLTYLEHGRMKGWVAATHKYLDRVWKNGKWVYSYAKKTGSGALRTAKSTAKNFTKSLSKSTNSGLKRIGSMMDSIRKRYGGNAKATLQNTLNTAKKEGKYLATKTKNAAKRAYSEAKSTAKVTAQNAANTAKKEGKYLATKTKNAAKRAYSEAKSTAKQAKVSAQNAANTAKKEGKYLTTKTKNAAKKTVNNVKKKNYVERAKYEVGKKTGKYEDNYPKQKVIDAGPNKEKPYLHWEGSSDRARSQYYDKNSKFERQSGYAMNNDPRYKRTKKYQLSRSTKKNSTRFK